MTNNLLLSLKFLKQHNILNTLETPIKKHRIVIPKKCKLHQFLEGKQFLKFNDNNQINPFSSPVKNQSKLNNYKLKKLKSTPTLQQILTVRNEKGVQNEQQKNRKNSKQLDQYGFPMENVGRKNHLVKIPKFIIKKKKRLEIHSADERKYKLNSNKILQFTFGC